MKQLYSLDEFCIIPSYTTEISSRSECNIFYNNNKLPIYVAPMSSLVDESNYEKFDHMGLNVIIPRSVDFDKRFDMMKCGCMVAVGLNELEHLYQRFSTSKIQEGELQYIPHICLDQANGHMQKSMELCESIKKLLGYDKVYIMVGNIANPETYMKWANIGVDAVRLGIGGGSVCTTSVLTGIHYPMGSLIKECNDLKYTIANDIIITKTELIENNPYISENDIINMLPYKSIPKIIADGGINRIDLAIKALALGADYVMLGEVVAKSKEACGKPVWDSRDSKYKREYYGMSTHKAQNDINESTIYQHNIKSEEGISRFVNIEYSMGEWLYTFESALKSAMSYTNKNDINKFISNVKVGIINPLLSHNYSANKEVSYGFGGCAK